MRRTLFLCLVAGLLLQFPVGVAAGQTSRPGGQTNPPLPIEHGGKIESKYDGFSHETVVALRKMSITCSSVRGDRKFFKNLCVSVAASLHCPGKQLDYVKYVKLQLHFDANDWDARHPLGERNLSVVADGQTIQLGTMQLSSTGVGNGWLDERMREVFEVAVKYETFERIARAEYVEMSIGKTAFELREKNVAAMRDLTNRVKIAARQ